jgi:hypothetical protein
VIPIKVDRRYNTQESILVLLLQERLELEVDDSERKAPCWCYRKKIAPYWERTNRGNTWRGGCVEALCLIKVKRQVCTWNHLSIYILLYPFISFLFLTVYPCFTFKKYTALLNFHFEHWLEISSKLRVWMMVEQNIVELVAQWVELVNLKTSYKGIKIGRPRSYRWMTGAEIRFLVWCRSSICSKEQRKENEDNDELQEV